MLPDNNPSVSGIAAGISKGRIWKDKNHANGLIITYSYCVGGYGITGCIDNYTDDELRRFFDSLFKQLVAENENWFEFSSEDQNINSRLLNLFSDKKIESEMEYSYRRNRKYETLRSIPESVCIINADRNFFEKLSACQIANEKMFTERFINSWENETDFLKYSKSFVAMKNDRIVGIIFGSARYEDVITVDIEVEKNFRNQGIAMRLAQEMMNSCAEDGLTLQWDCVEGNIPSRELVTHLEFEPLKQRLYYWFQIEEDRTERF